MLALFLKKSVRCWVCSFVYSLLYRDRFSTQIISSKSFLGHSGSDAGKTECNQVRHPSIVISVRRDSRTETVPSPGWQWNYRSCGTSPPTISGRMGRCHSRRGQCLVQTGGRYRLFPVGGRVVDGNFWRKRGTERNTKWKSRWIHARSNSNK